MGGTILFGINVDTQLFAEGTEDMMAAAVDTCLKEGASGGYFVLSPGCRIPHNMKPENTRAFIEAAHRLGSAERFNAL